MASKFYFIQKGKEFKVYELDCTKDATIDEQAITTTRATENKADLTSHYRLMPRTVRYNGLITNIKSYQSDSVDVNEWLNEIRSARATTPTPTWTVYTNGQVIPNCLITGLSANTDSNIGDQAWGISITFQEVRFTDQAKLTVLPEPKEASKKDVQDKNSKNSNTTKQTGKPLMRTPLLTGLDYILVPEGGFNGSTNTGG